jgi:endo-1,4-beta-xylanase
MNAATLHELANHFELAFAEITEEGKLEIAPRPIPNGGSLTKAITSIDELLKHDISYPRFTPVMLFDRSPWRKFVDVLLRRKLLAAVFALTSSILPFYAWPREAKAVPPVWHYVVLGTAVDPSFLNEPIYSATLAREFSMIEAEASMKWATIHPKKGVYDFREGDALVRFAKQNNMLVRGHCLLWGLYLPEWLGSPKVQGKLGNVLHNHISTVARHYRGGGVFAWDVVNEAFSQGGDLKSSLWYDSPGIGAGPGTAYIEKAFAWAHEADPAAKLFYNDFGAEELNKKSDAIYAMVKDFRQRGVPIDGVGFQAHLQLNGLNIVSFKANLARFAALGVEVHITELDVALPNGATAEYGRQAAIYRAVVGACASEPACTAVQTWGFTDKHSWIPWSTQGKLGDALLFDKNYNAKPAYAAVREELSKGGKS